MGNDLCEILDQVPEGSPLWQCSKRLKKDLPSQERIKWHNDGVISSHRIVKLYGARARAMQIRGIEFGGIAESIAILASKPCNLILVSVFGKSLNWLCMIESSSSSLKGCIYVEKK